MASPLYRYLRNSIFIEINKITQTEPDKLTQLLYVNVETMEFSHKFNSLNSAISHNSMCTEQSFDCQNFQNNSQLINNIVNDRNDKCHSIVE